MGGEGICGHFESRTLDQNTHLHLTVRAGNTLFRATVSITCGSYFKIVTRLAKWSQE